MDLFRKLGHIPEEGPSFRVETSCSIKRLLEDEELCCWIIIIIIRGGLEKYIHAMKTQRRDN